MIIITYVDHNCAVKNLGQRVTSSICVTLLLLLLLLMLLNSPSYLKLSEHFVCDQTQLPHYYRNLSAIQNIKLSRYKAVVKASGTHIRKHGLILIYISKVCCHYQN